MSMNAIRLDMNESALDYIRKIKCYSNARAVYVDFLKGLDSRFHLTVTFRHGMDERSTVTLLNDLLKRLNRAILKKRYNEHGQFIEGVAVKESTYAMDNVHYHIILCDKEGKLPYRERMEELISQKVNQVNQNSTKLNQIGKFMIQDYYEGSEESSLENYLTKLLESPWKSMQDKFDCFSPLGHNGIQYLV